MEANILDGKYMVSLDAIDVNLLTTQKVHKKHSEDVAPLWSISNLAARYNEFYEFEALFDETSIQNEDSDSKCVENINVYTCHLCNIDVPKSYIKEHNSGNKHRTCSAIAEHSLDRIKQHLAQGIDTASAKTNTSTYFCEPCALVVRVNNKANHEKSKEHTISVKHDKLLNDLLKAYIDKNYATVHEFDKSDDTIEKTVAIAKVLDEDHNTIEKLTDISTTDDVTPKLMTENKVNEITLAADEKLKNLKEYIKILSRVNIDEPKHSLSTLDEDYIEIKAMSDQRVKVPVDNFHGFFNVENFVQCRVCRVMVEDKESHKMIPDHMAKIAAPIRNKHCVRQLDEIWNHCILCNQIVENIDVHVQCSELHISLMIEAVIKSTNEPDKGKRKLNKNEQIVCEVCNVRMSTNNLNSHLRGMKHKMLLKQKQLFDGNSSEEEVIDYQMKKSKDSDELTCRICDVIVSNVTEHISADKHKYKYENLLSMNAIIILRDRVCCEVCEAYMMEEYILYHVESKKHKKKLKSMSVAESSSVTSGLTGIQFGRNKETKLKKSNRHFELTYDENKLKCKTCKIFIENDKRIAKSHRKSFSHDAHFRSMLDENELEYIGNKISCKLCNSIFRLRSMLDHIDNEIHKRNLFNHSKALESESIVLISPIVKYDNSVQSIENDFETHEAQNEFNFKETIFYHRSENQETDVDNNLTTKSEQQTKRGDMMSEVEKVRRFCKICDIYITESAEFNHEASDSHRSNILNFSKSSNHTNKAITKTGNQIYEADNEIKLPEAAERSTNDDLTSDDDLQDISIHYQIKSSNNSIEMICKSSEEILLAINKLTKIDDNNYFCDICTLLIPHSLKFDHINTDNHRYKFNNLYGYGSSYSDNRTSLDSIYNKTTPLVPSAVNLTHTRQDQNEQIPVTNDDMVEKSNLPNIKVKKESELQANKRIIEPSLNTNNNNDKINLSNKVPLHYMLSEDSSNPKQVICKVCKVKVPYLERNMEEHVTGFNHATKYTSFLTENKLITINNEIYCGACDLNLPENSEYEHIKGSGHITNISKDSNDDNNKMNLPKKVQLHYMMTKDLTNPKQVICKVCKAIIPNLERNIDEHVKGFNHITNYTTILHENKLSIVDNKMYCETCKENVPEQCEFDHMDGGTHKNNVLSNKCGEKVSLSHGLHHLLSVDTKNPKVVICIVCNIRVNHVEKNIIEHIQGSNHTYNHNEFLLQNKLKKVDNNIYCELCDVFVPESCTVDHVKDNKQHILNVSNHDKNQLHYMLSKDPENDNQVICKVCNMRVPFVARNMDEHIKGSNHTSNYSFILIQNHMKKVNEKIYCEICNVYMSQKKELDHINDNTHVINVSNNTVASVKPNTIVVNQKTVLHFMMWENPENPGQVICKVCNVKVPKTTININDHTKGSKHTNLYKTILSENKLKVVNDKIHCELCNLRGSEATVFNHIDSDIHKLNYINRIVSAKAQGSATSKTFATQDSNRILVNSKGNCQTHVDEHAVKVQSDTHVTQNVIGTSIFQKKPINDNAKNIATGNSMIHYLMETTDNPKELTCKICNSRVPFRDDLMIEHIEGLKHNSKYKSILEVNRINKIADGYYCNVCTSFMDIGLEYNHMCDWKHHVNLANYSQPSSSRMASKLETEIVPENELKNQGAMSEPNELIKIEQTAEVVHYLMQKTNDNQFVCCKVCKVLVPSKSKYITKHVTSSDHNAKFDPILSKNSIKKTDNDKRLLCAVCNLYLRYADVFEHINDDNHKINKSDATNTKLTSNASKAEEFCNLCQAYFINMKAHVLQQHTANTKDNPTYICEACRCKVPKSKVQIEQHENSARHKTNFENILTENTIRMRDDRVCFCEICNLYFTKLSVFKHIQSVSHKWQSLN